jgi:hypothetical protein
MVETPSDQIEQRWALIARTAHRSGAITAIAGVFSSRGVNFDSLVASALTPETAVVIGLYQASQRHSAQLVRTVGRLDVVDSVSSRPATDPSVRAAGIVDLTATKTLSTDTDSFAVPASESPRLVQGSLQEVERIAGQAVADGGTAIVVVLAI